MLLRAQVGEVGMTTGVGGGPGGGDYSSRPSTASADVSGMPGGVHRRRSISV